MIKILPAICTDGTARSKGCLLGQRSSYLCFGLGLFFCRFSSLFVVRIYITFLVLATTHRQAEDTSTLSGWWYTPVRHAFSCALPLACVFCLFFFFPPRSRTPAFFSCAAFCLFFSSKVCLFVRWNVCLLLPSTLYTAESPRYRESQAQIFSDFLQKFDIGRGMWLTGQHHWFIYDCQERACCHEGVPR